MGKPHIDIPKEKIAEFCKKWKIREFSFFGSVLRYDFRPDSDIDVMVDFEPDAIPGMFDMVSMTDELKEILGRKVDLVTRRGVEQSRNYILRRAILSSLPAGKSRETAYLLDILLMSKAARNFTTGLDKDAFLSDRKVQDAVIFCLDMMKKSVKRLSDDTIKLSPEIPLSVMVRVRDIKVHPYDKIDLGEVWDVVQNDILTLISALEKIIPPEDEI